MEDPKVVKEIPNSINVVNHVSSRIRELRKIYNDVATKKSEMLIHQKLPNFMRRRAMSHNPKRLPAKYRKIHKSQMAKSGLEDKTKKRPSRKYRRKPNNLLKEYTRRSKANVWLETHIWHSKRFKMKNIWGYRIPYTPTDKRYKASYRAAIRHCLLQDISFYPCIELSGSFDELKKGLMRIINKNEMPTITAKCYLSGLREGKCIVFKADSYPYHAIGEISFIWRTNQEDKQRSLWIFSHPLVYHELLNEFQGVFELKSSDSNISRNTKFQNLTTKVTLISFKDTINRFRLTGSHSNAVLSKAFNISAPSNWLQELCSGNESFLHSHEAQMEFFEKFKLTNSPLELPLHCVINLNIDDPRINRNNGKRIISKIETFSDGSHDFELSDKISNSPLWDKEQRDKITISLMSNAELNKLRYKKQLIPAIPTSFEKSVLQPIPILIIQQPNNLMSGWDVIVPSGYGLTVWLSLIKFGAKAGGWKEYEMILSEMGKEIFEPDTCAAIKENKSKEEELRMNYFKRPPNKRTNFTKLGIASPFYCPFESLFKEWNGDKFSNFYLLRDSKVIEDLKKVLSLKKKIDSLKLEESSLIPVKIQMISNGAPRDFSILCLPSKKDIKYAKLTKFKNSSAYHEEIHNDPNELKRKIKKFSHKKLLKRLKNRRVRERKKKLRKGLKNDLIKSQSKQKELNELIKKQFDEMCTLWLPQPTSIRHQCSREVIGYVTKSRFTFSLGKVSSIGYVPAKAFEAFIKKFEGFKNVKPFVLIRSPNSTCFYTAKIII